MTTQTASASAIELKTKLPYPLHFLADLAFNFWWSWSPDRLSIFRVINSQLWEECDRNPVKLLAMVSDERLAQLAIDPYYLSRVRTLENQFRHYMDTTNTWANQKLPQLQPQQPIAYFSIEYGFHPCIPTYAGGLGVLAADHLKSASDLGVPVVGVGLLYRQGYFRQHFDGSGWQKEEYRDHTVEQLPLELCQDQQGQVLTIDVEIRDRTVKAQIWQVRLGRVNLYLLDTNFDDNQNVDRWITGQLYGGNQDTRLAQEILLGIGGVRALQTLGFDPQIYHLNEGHATCAMLEVVRQDIERTGKSFQEAKKAARSRGVFTTHTPVPAGHDIFSNQQIDSYFHQYWTQLGLSRQEFLDLGTRRSNDPWEPFNMTILALRLTKAANGVSKLNGEVCRQMWSSLYPNRPIENVPIGHITNGVHLRTWTAPLMADLYSQYLDKDWVNQVTNEQMWAKIDEIPDWEIWWRHQCLKAQLIAHIRSHLQKKSRENGKSAESIAAVANLFDPNALTIGFARRMTTYKRGDLIITDPERAKAMFSHAERPVQIVFAGKAHPADYESKQIIQRLIQWGNQPEIQHRFVFLEDYDLHIAEKLVQGVDLWLNNPLRTREASGTSGQKVALNGGINCSILDGWWCEAYQASPEGKGINGWAIRNGDKTEVAQLQNQPDAEALYDLLENEIIPLYYDEDEQGLKRRWIQRMKASIKTIAPFFNTERMLAEYIQQMYLPQCNVEFELVSSGAD